MERRREERKIQVRGGRNDAKEQKDRKEGGRIGEVEKGGCTGGRKGLKEGRKEGRARIIRRDAEGGNGVRGEMDWSAGWLTGWLAVGLEERTHNGSLDSRRDTLGCSHESQLIASEHQVGRGCT
ncbi:hypothetical protein Pcinc_041747 [Petrolisthes cinctipes]|uniref:Uncharacterized protein n=1 Tax=Petrolisthes cinctipes TaxID=88211 RepID=A0AAE1BIW0_PETCI|nr:hypothetical protein Pcinc_041747 [Petrolisthes cinctipes]